VGFTNVNFALQLSAARAIGINLVASAVQRDVARAGIVWHANSFEKTHRIVRRYRFCGVTFTAQKDAAFLLAMRRI
jgi:hypothetical protein